MSHLSDSNSHATSKVTDRQPPGIYNSLRWTLHTHQFKYTETSTSSNPGAVWRPDLSRYNSLQSPYELQNVVWLSQGCFITGTNSAVFTINGPKMINSSFTELRYFSNSKVMSPAGLGANKWGGIETTLLEAADGNKRKASKQPGFLLDYVPIGDNNAQEVF